VDWIARRALPGALEFLPCQAETRAERFPQIPYEQCMEGMQLVLPGGHVCSGEQALPDLFRMMKRWRWIAFIIELPVIAWTSPYMYRWIARHRYMISAFVQRKSVELDQPYNAQCDPRK